MDTNKTQPTASLPRLVRRVRWYLVRWMVQWACLLDAAIVVVTLGAWSGTIALKAEGWFLDVSDSDFNQYGDYA